MKVKKLATLRSLALALATTAILSGVAFAVVTVTKNVSATVRVQVDAPDGIEIYLDEALTQPAEFIDFGEVSADVFGSVAGEPPSVPVWIKNVSFSEIRLSLSDDFVHGEVEFQGGVQQPLLQPDEVLAGMLTLRFSQGVPGEFNFAVAVRAEGPVPSPINKGGHINVGSLEFEFTNLNPATVNQVRQFQLTRQIISGLTLFDENLAARPELAESWEVSPDGLTWTFYIRPNARFSTGRDYTADDVIFSYDNTLNPDTQSIHTKGLEGVNRPVRIDDKTVQISTAAPRASMLTKVTEGTGGRVLTAVDMETIEAIGQAGFNRTPVGAGWFKVNEHVFGERLELEGNPFYWDAANRPIVDSATVFNIGEGATLVAALKTAQLDFVESYPVEFFSDLSGTSGIVISDTPDIGFQAIFFNRRPADDRASKGIRSVLPTDDVRIRRALGNALDRQVIIDRAFQGRAVPAFSPINPALAQFYDPTLPERSLQRYDPDEANRLLAEVAAERGEELGIAPDGHFTLTLSTAVQNSTPAQAIKAAIEEVLGIAIELELTENAVFQPRFIIMEMESALTGSGGDPDPDDAVDDWFADGSKFNGYGYNSPRVNELNFLQKTAVDVEQRRLYLLEMQEILTNDMPALFTYHLIQSNAFRGYVKGYIHVPALADLDKVWLDR